ncbi:GMC oxidoreductase [Sphingomonas sp. LHG3406-1]|uniref:GMC oxidoreductase n=1 Tax=Sphingomonas sp. LHG3406-1 TaxID=2804617 RepID=UPI0026175994|nr:GMC family oxidoreductase [Sphingomonas sp. LHG3406-1]
MPFTREPRRDYDVAVVGTGFSSSFFLLGLLSKLGPDARILVVERGGWMDHASRTAAARAPEPGSGDESAGKVQDDAANTQSDQYYRGTGNEEKVWRFTIGFGGGSNCWWSNVPRFLPSDFQTRSRFGVGRDWPIGYDDLAPYYDQVETVMSLAGPEAPWPFPRDKAYPQPQHRFNDAERLLKKAYPTSFFSVPTARARVATEGRNVCCGNGVCHLCPVDAKFTIQNGLLKVYRDPRVDVLLGSEVIGVEKAAGRATGIRYRLGGGERVANAGLVVLGSNALFNPVILQRSGIDHPKLGRGLHEQVGQMAEVFLDGVEGFNGSTSVTGHSYLLYDDDQRRRQMAACLVETWNIGRIRTERGRWQQVLPVRMVFEDFPSDDNYAAFDPANPARPIMHFTDHSAYTQKAIDRAAADLARIMAPLPVERIEFRPVLEESEAHIIGTTPMGKDPATSIVDPNLVHHQLRNLLVLGSSTFPQGGPANPTLTLSALALRAADRLAGASA